MSATETETFPTQAAGLMVGFNRHGLPGLVIGVLFVYLAAGFWLGLSALGANTAATNAVAVAMNRLADAIEKENRK